MSRAELSLPGLPARYRVVRLLGVGSQKRVYLARDLLLDRSVALSVVDGRRLAHLLREGLHEAQALARISDHPNVVSIYDLIESPPLLFIVSQYAPGGSLRVLLSRAKGAGLPLERALRIALHVGRALAFAHERGIVHQDLKPENVLLDERGNALLADLGIAEVHGLRSVLDPSEIVGSPAYIAPELIAGGAPSARSDLYSLGCLLYELLSGRTPFASHDYRELLRMHVEREAAPLSAAATNVSPQIDSLVLHLLAKDPYRRPRSGREVATALEAILEERLVDSERLLRDRVSVGPSSAPQLFGRDAELSALRRALARAASGEPSVLVLDGDAGAGKTRLVHELRSIAAARGMTSLVGCGREDAALPYQAIAEALRPLAGELHLFADSAADALRLLLSLPRDADARRAATAHRDLESLCVDVLQLLRTIAEHRPLLIVLDDLQWVDVASRVLFERIASAVASEPEGARMRVVLTCCVRRGAVDADTASALARMLRHPCATELEIEGLDLPAVHALIASLGVERPANQLTQLALELTNGNPLFVRELVRHLQQANLLATQAGFTVVIGEQGGISLPSSLTGAIAERIEQASADCRDLLTAASFLGPRFELAVLAELTERSEDEVLEVLERAAADGFVVDRGHAFAFAHPLIRRAFSDRLSPTRRQRMHLRIAERMQSSGTRSSIEIAHHLLAAGPAAERRTALELARRASEEALAQLAWTESARFLEAVLSLDAGDLAPLERTEVHRKAAIAYAHGSDVGPACHHFNEAIRGFKLADDAAGLARTAVAKSRFLSIHGALRMGELGGVDELHAAQASLGDAHPELRARVLGALADAYWNALRVDEGEKSANAALSLALELGDHALCAEIYLDVSKCQAQRLRIAEAIRSLERSMDYADRARDPVQLDLAAQRLPPLLFMVGRLDEVDAAVENTTGVHRSDLLLGPTSRATVAAIRGDLDRAEQCAEEALRRLGTSKFTWAASAVLTTLAYVRAIGGDWASANDAMQLLVQPGVVFAQPNPRAFSVYRHLIRVYAGIEVEPSAREELRPVRNADHPDYFSVVNACAQLEIATALGDVRIDDSVDQVLRRAAESDLLFTPGWPFLVPRLRALAAWRAGDCDEAVMLFEEAIRIAVSASADSELFRALLDFARMLRSLGSVEHGERAQRLLERAVSLSHGRFSERWIERGRSDAVVA